MSQLADQSKELGSVQKLPEIKTINQKERAGSIVNMTSLPTEFSPTSFRRSFRMG